MIINGKEINEKTLAALIDDSSARGPEQAALDAAIARAKKYKFRSLCVSAARTEYCVEQLKDSGVRVCVALDYPDGSSSPSEKYKMVQDVVRKGADDIDVTLDLAALKAKNYKLVVDGIRQVVEACEGRVSKIICEVKYLTMDEMLAAADCVQEGGADYYKTSAVYGGADMNRILPLRERLTDAKLKVSGTGSFWMPAIALGSLAAGCDIFGCHDGEQLIRELPIFEQIYSNIKF